MSVILNRTSLVISSLCPEQQVCEWIVHLVISQSGHPASRRAVLGCILRTAQESWNIGNFNGVMEILLGLR